MKRKEIAILIIFLLAWPIYAAVDVTMQGSIYAEVASEPGTELRAGTRIQLYSELASSGFASGKIRLIGLNQKAGDLNSFYSRSHFVLDNLINWVEIQLMGYMFPNGPVALMSIGNVEIDYSPYTISLKDDLLNEHYSSYSVHRGIALKEVYLGGLDCDGFFVGGFGDINKNAVGGRVIADFGGIKLSGIIVDYRYRTPNAQGKIKSSPLLVRELEWDQTKSIEVEKSFSQVGTLRALHVNQNQKKHEKLTGGEISTSLLDTTLKEYEWEALISKESKILLGYRDIPLGFDPLFRDRTPEFDPREGFYLGYNPVDRYHDRLGFYSRFETQLDNTRMCFGLERFQDHGPLPATFRALEFSMENKQDVYTLDLYTRLITGGNWLSTGIRNMSEGSFNRLLVTRDLAINKNPLVLGAELRFDKLAEDLNNQGIIFIKYKRGNIFELDAGVIQALAPDSSGGNFLGINYKAPNGLEFNYRQSNPEVVREKRYLYDPDYRIREHGSIVKLSAKVEF